MFTKLKHLEEYMYLCMDLLRFPQFCRISPSRTKRQTAFPSIKFPNIAWKIDFALESELEFLFSKKIHSGAPQGTMSKKIIMVIHLCEESCFWSPYRGYD